MATLNRRRFLLSAGGLVGGLALVGCRPRDLLPGRIDFDPQPPAATDQDWRILNRITFGPRPEERHRFIDIGPAAFVEEQLAPESIEEDARSMLQIRRLASLHLDYSAIFDVPPKTIARELQQATLLRAIYSRRQLYELMVHFWSHHFNIDQGKGDCLWLKTIDDREVIRRHALGKFRDLLQASAHSPAMLVYLDNHENYAGNPNENYARELMELHTLSVNGGYSQTDVQELARCLTGWTVSGRRHRGQFAFDADRHDGGPKTVFGFAVAAGSGEGGGEAIIDRLAGHPATAHFIATKLVRRFIADEPPPTLVEQAAATFLESDGDIKAVLRAILLSPEMLAPTADQRRQSTKLKLPFEFVAGALRQLNAQTDGGQPLLNYLVEMGQPLFGWPTPDGYPDQAEAWQGTLLSRWRFALALTTGQIPGTSLDFEALRGQKNMPTTDRLNQFATLLLGQPLDPALTHRLLTQSDLQDDHLLVAGLLGSPAFQWK